jgi:hypothetical protein
MSIAHSTMLLVTLVFVLTTRGIALDFSAAGRSGPRTDISSPISSPPVNRPSSMLFGQSFRNVSEGADITTEPRKTGASIRHFDTIGDSIQSAPATPTGVPKAWQINSPSPLAHYEPPLPDEPSHRDKNSSIDEESASRFVGMEELDDEFLIMEDESEMVANRYLTPLSNVEE